MCTCTFSFSVFQIVDMTINLSLILYTTQIQLSLFYETRMAMCFPAKITLSCIWVAIHVPVDWVILHWYACGADGRTCAVTWLSEFLGWVHYHIFLDIALRSWRSAITLEVGYHPKSLKEFYRLKALITLEQVNTSVVKKNLNEPNFHGEANWSSVV